MKDYTLLGPGYLARDMFGNWDSFTTYTVFNSYNKKKPHVKMIITYYRGIDQFRVYVEHKHHALTVVEEYKSL